MTKPYRYWTQDEINNLYLWAGELPPEKIARRLKRSKISVKGKAQVLNVNLKLEVDNLSVNEVAKLLSCNQKSLLRWITKGVLKGKKKDPGLSKSRWRINRKELKRFYKANPHIKLFKNTSQENLDWLIN